MNIILTTLNARYAHTSIALRYLYANLKEYQRETEILEFTINDNIHEIVEKLLKDSPSVIGIGVYIWNALEVSTIIDIIKKVSPETIVVLGGPEVSHTPYRVDFSKADHIIIGEGENKFYNLIDSIKRGLIIDKSVDNEGVPVLRSLNMPYEFYSDHDIQNRIIYVEASRGCPFKCEFCLSSIDKKVRDFEIEKLLNEFQKLWDRGARNFKFIDRTFNLNIEKSNKILDFFLGKDDGFLVHFEVIPEFFPKSIKDKITEFKPGTIQLEVGIQTLNEDIAYRINRKMDFEKIEENLRFLEEQTDAHLHVDLIIGLPGESLESFADNLNRLGDMTNCEIQLGVLKKLSGTTLDRHDKTYKMIYSDLPPYEILQNSDIPFLKMQEMKRFTRYWDLAFNSGNFKQTIKNLWIDGDIFSGFYKFSTWIYNRSKTTYQISLNRLSEYLFEYLTEVLDFNKTEIADIMVADITKINGRKLPGFLREFATYIPPINKGGNKDIGKRQARHRD